MLEFVTAENASMDAFLAPSAASPYQEQLKEYSDSLLEQGFTRPEWCLLGLEAGTPVARAALWALAGQAVPTDSVLIEADWSDVRLAAGHALLERLHELAGAFGADGINHSLDSPPVSPQYQENEDARDRLLRESGYELLRDGLRWQYFASTSSEDKVEVPSLAFRTLPEVGEDAFVEAIASTYDGIRDSWVRQGIEERGTLGAARADFHEQQGMDHLPEWWELAFTADGDIAGVIMAARNPTVAVISYVGVVPEQRGRGVGPQLVRRGIDRLRAAGADEIRGDCDSDNVGMVKAFERAGFEQFARRRTYHRALASG